MNYKDENKMKHLTLGAIGFIAFCLAFINHKMIHLLIAISFLIGALVGMFYGGT